MQPVKVGKSWRIKTEWGDYEGWYLTERQALIGIAKRLRERQKTTEVYHNGAERE